MEEMNERTTNLELVEEDRETSKSSAVSIGLAMLIGSGLTLAGIAVGKKLKSILAKYEAEEDFEEDFDSEEDFEFEEVETNSEDDEESEQEEN